MKKIDSRRRQKLGMSLGIALGLGATSYTLLVDRTHALGPMNPGHENLKCNDCHRQADGTLRQQIQATVYYWLGSRSEPVSVGRNPVTNDQCLDCHERPKDKHPVYRFLEPRFVKARKEISPQFCATCHNEHQGRRMSIKSTFCSNCHEKLSVKNDPLDISHRDLIERKRWDSCLACHDFHGNHRMKPPKKLAAALSDYQIADYFATATSPYSKEKYYTARKEVKHER